VKKSDQSDYIDWDAGREGYVQTKAKFVPVVTIPKETPKERGKGGLLSVRAEERLGSLIAAAAAIWVVHLTTIDFNNLWQMPVLPAGPCEVGAVGILMWLHAKWRRSIKV
jgi:hypothetical protein